MVNETTRRREPERRWIGSGLAILGLVALLASPASVEAQRVKVNVGGAGPGAGAYVLMGGLAELVARESKTVEMTAITTKGLVHNIRLVESRDADFGLANSPLMYSAMRSQHPFKTKYLNARAVGPVTMTWFHLVTPAKGNVKTFEDLKGKRISLAEKGSNTEYMTSLILKAGGLYDAVSKEYLRWDDAARAMVDGRLDAFSIPNPIPSPSILQAASSIPIHWISLPQDIIAGMMKENPGYFKATVEAGAYNGMKEPAETIGYVAFTIVNKDVPDDVVYEVTRLAYTEAGKKFLPTVHPGWKSGQQTAPGLEVYEAIGLKLHPGAERFWREQGHTIPEKISNR